MPVLILFCLKKFYRTAIFQNIGLRFEARIGCVQTKRVEGYIPAALCDAQHTHAEPRSVNISACGEDLVSHCEIENLILVPAVEALEKAVCATNRSQNSCTSGNQELSHREKDIIRLVAHGLANKEIADRLSLSFHTITTYRKNISSKLNIHSTAALTIFAILHGIVDPKEIELK